METGRELALAAGKAVPDTSFVREAAGQVEGSPETNRRRLEEHLAKAEGLERSPNFSLKPTVLAPKELARFLIAFVNVGTPSGRNRCRAQIESIMCQAALTGGKITAV